MINLMRILPTILIVICCFSTMFAQKGDALVHRVLESSKFQNNDLAYEITSEHLSSASGVYHIYFRQLYEEIPILGTESSLHLDSNDFVLAERLKFIAPANLKDMGAVTKSLSPKQAIEAVASSMKYQISQPLLVLDKKGRHSNEFWLSNGGISQRDIKSRLVFIPNEANAYTLVWEVDILQLDNQHWWEFYVDATTGEIVAMEDRMRSCDIASHKANDAVHDVDYFRIKNDCSPLPNTASCTECYEVIEYPLESPYFGKRSIVENPADPIASPYGWHDTNGIPGPEYTTTRGNNADVYESNDNFGYHPDGGQSLEFTGYDFDQEFTSENQYVDASITNLFYWTNIVHDITYRYGFTESAGNFQVNNYDRGGVAGDDINTFGQSVVRRCNGSFSTPEDGERPHMIINICRNKDGDFDSTLIVHEWGHGLSNRLTGGGAVVNCLRNTENPSEGWSDWLATILTMQEGHTGETPRYIASYLRDHGQNGPGVRFFPYSTNMTDNPLTYDDLPDREGVHRIGAIWGTMIWEMTWALIDEYGFDEDIYNFTGNINQDAGNIMAMAIVTEGMKITACRPGFVDARDAIITAARQIYGHEVLCFVWRAFAKRGLGVWAEQGDSDNQFDGTSSYANPFDDVRFYLENEVFCYESDYQNVVGASPLGGVYIGPGVTDNGDGESFNFDPKVAGPGTHTITYVLAQTACAEAESISKEIRVEEDVTAPQIECVSDAVFNVPIGKSYELFDFRGNTPTTDNCPGELEVIQTPAPGTILTTSENEITITSTDGVGNQAICSFNLTLVFITEEEITDGGFTVLPNPVSDEIVLYNPQEKKIVGIEIWDLLGRRVQNLVLDSTESENRFSVEELSSGTYFIMINTIELTKMIRLVKN